MLSSCALMGTDRAGRVRPSGVVVATGPRTAFGRIAVGLATASRTPSSRWGCAGSRSCSPGWPASSPPPSLSSTSCLTVRLIDAVLFSLAIAVGITPQLLPAVVTMSLATGTRALTARGVLVKRLVCVEDIGNVEVLLTDKTGTLTEGRISLRRAVSTDGEPSSDPLLWRCWPTRPRCRTGSPSAGTRSMWRCGNRRTPSQPVADYRRVALLPFDHERRRVSVLVDGPTGRLLITKGAPEELLTCAPPCPTAPGSDWTPNSTPAAASSPWPAARAPDLDSCPRR